MNKEQRSLNSAEKPHLRKALSSLNRNPPHNYNFVEHAGVDFFQDLS